MTHRIEIDMRELRHRIDEFRIRQHGNPEWVGLHPDTLHPDTVERFLSPDAPTSVTVLGIPVHLSMRVPEGVAFFPDTNPALVALWRGGVIRTQGTYREAQIAVGQARRREISILVSPPIRASAPTFPTFLVWVGGVQIGALDFR